MSRETEPQPHSAAGALFAIVLVSLMAYLTYAALQGEHGLFRLFQIEAQESRLRTELQEIRAERTVIANKTKRLSPDRIDLELLDEQARKILGLGRRDEIIIR